MLALPRMANLALILGIGTSSSNITGHSLVYHSIEIQFPNAGMAKRMIEQGSFFVSCRFPWGELSDLHHVRGGIQNDVCFLTRWTQPY